MAEFYHCVINEAGVCTEIVSRGERGVIQKVITSQYKFQFFKCIWGRQWIKIAVCLQLRINENHCKNAWTCDQIKIKYLFCYTKAVQRL